ncbi:NAD(P)-dependent dehydrogenase (short-subunit alcohol dehydrogenase family) [Litorivivens lipolytica]|uniref:NAD(P)-dependent dehydrogenase (Short-subunit alcohol dehydrogenase family) n=1 Tax=Litorivivens lipolytica TaxID=1524264 RepID=A0A7W4Z5Y1_9GAMM|nr:SDR family oxidoreductase [Litorivivens lipolytica]MBB3047974.1 NAD(P)-dependent dehydrogenase (short-subunit alcohol dehydrogenase family) [Litorivivens lipolytica]
MSKSVVITGSTRGIGRGLAENFLKQGCNVVISATLQPAVDQAVSELAAQFGADKVVGQACDISEHSQLENLWRFAKAQCGTVDIWINNAGISLPRKPITDQSAEDLARITSINLNGVLFAANVVLGGMKAQGGGQFWVMEGFGSNGAAQPGMAAYGATKRGVNYLAKALRKDMAGSNVQVNVLSPGIVVTDLLIGDYDTSSPEWEKAKKIFNILGDKVETVTPWLVNGVLKAQKDGARVEWLTTGKAFRRFMTAGFNKRDLFAETA